MEAMEKWLGVKFTTGISPGKDYLKFQSAARRDLMKKAATAGFELHSFMGNHYEFSAVLKHTENGAFVYVAISDVRFFQDKWYNHVLIRNMKHDKDWRGGPNHYCRWPDLSTAVRTLLQKKF